MALALLSACGAESRENTTTDTTDTTVADSADSAAGDAILADTIVADTALADTDDAPPPNILEAMQCGSAPPTGPGTGGVLQRFPLDLTSFPDAICNDGSNAVFYFRPYVGEANKNKWLINLNGGGGCGNGPSCAARWCGCTTTTGPNGCHFAENTTNFNRNNMNGDERPTIDDGGIFRRGDVARPNPIGDYNQVRLIYCSSDAWIGTRRDSPLTAINPRTGVEVSFSIHFLGARILDAALTTLRRDGVSGARYSLGSSPRDLPDLDDAVEVIVSGDSAGGSGTISNLDRIADLLRAHNSTCIGGGACPLVVRGLMDAIVGPELERLDYSTSVYAENGGTSYDLVMSYAYNVQGAVTGARYDESCLSWHAANAPGTEAQCADIMHIVRNHVTTPFFVRMALIDGLISGNYIEAEYSDPELGILTLPKFAVILQRELAAFPDLRDTAEEGGAMNVAPGVFAPACAKHDTIHDDGEVYQTTITPDGGSPLRLFDVFENWRNGTSPTAVLTQKETREDTSCAP